MTNETSSDKGSPSIITLGLSILTHFLLVAPVTYILVLSFRDYSFFTLHPIFSTVGVCLLVTEAVFSVSGEAYIASKVSRRNRVTIHWILTTIGMSMIVIGLITIIITKRKYARPHFVTIHAQLGLVTIILSVLTAFFGILAKYTTWLYPHVRPMLIRIGHAFVGILVTILLIATVINGTYSWWPGTIIGRNLTFASFFIAGFLILAKPILGIVSRCRVVFGPPPSEG